MCRFIDIHTHSSKGEASYELVSVDISDWHDTLLAASPTCSFSVGIHPYHSADVGLEECLARLEHVLPLDRVAALGEVGLDRRIAIPMEVQQRVFEAQLPLASRFAKPLIIHSVRTVPEVLAVLKRHRFAYPFIFHGFVGKPAMVDQIYQHGGYVSFGANILDNASWDDAVIQAYRRRILLLETDTSEKSIQAVYQRVAAILTVDLLELVEMITEAIFTIFTP